MRLLKLTFLLILYISLTTSCSVVPTHLFAYDKDNSKVDFKITGHRGAAGIAPENTMAGIQAALDLNIDRIEIDIHQSKDSVLMVIHDKILLRTTNGLGFVKNKTAETLGKLDAGSWFSKEFKDERIPTLDQVMELINGQCEVIIELKRGNDFYPGIEERIVETIDRYQAKDWSIVQSFKIHLLENIHKLDEDIKLHKLFLNPPFLISYESNKLINYFHLETESIVNNFLSKSTEASPQLVMLARGNFEILNSFDFQPHSSIDLLLSEAGNSLNFFDIDMYPFIDEYSLNYLFVNEYLVKYLKSKNKKVNVWTVNKVNIAKEMVNIGVDGIITDHPERFKTIKNGYKGRQYTKR